MRSLSKFIFIVCMLCSFSMAEFRTCRVTLVLANKVEKDYSYSLAKMSTTSAVMIGSPLLPEDKQTLGEGGHSTVSKFFFPDLPLDGKVNMQFTLKEDGLTELPVDISMELSECRPENVHISSSGFRVHSKWNTLNDEKNPFVLNTFVLVYLMEE